MRRFRTECDLQESSNSVQPASISISSLEFRLGDSFRTPPKSGSSESHCGSFKDTPETEVCSCIRLILFSGGQSYFSSRGLGVLESSCPSWVRVWKPRDPSTSKKLRETRALTLKRLPLSSSNQCRSVRRSAGSSRIGASELSSELGVGEGVVMVRSAAEQPSFSVAVNVAEQILFGEFCSKTSSAPFDGASAVFFPRVAKQNPALVPEQLRRLGGKC